MYIEVFVVDDPTTVACIKRISDGAFIPLDEDNRDYREYLEWKSSQQPSA